MNIYCRQNTYKTLEGVSFDQNGSHPDNFLGRISLNSKDGQCWPSSIKLGGTPLIKGLKILADFECKLFVHFQVNRLFFRKIKVSHFAILNLVNIIAIPGKKIKIVLPFQRKRSVGMFLGAWADRHTRFFPMMFPSVGNILNACAIIYMVYYPESSWLILLVGVSNYHFLWLKSNKESI